MINRQNWKDIEEFLTFQAEVKRLSPKSITRNRGAFRHILEWADDHPLTTAHQIRPTLPAYIDTLESYRQNKPTGHGLANKTKIKYCSLARQFFKWAALQWRERYKGTKPNWVESLRPHVTQAAPKEKEHYTLDEVIALVNIPGQDLRTRRDQAAAALLFLSGMRVGALATLPIEALDLEAGTVKQWPELGVETKGGKAATTFLLSNIPQLWEVVNMWDAFIRKQLPPTSPWYVQFTWDGQLDHNYNIRTSRNRRGTIANGLRRLCEMAEIPYKSPHKMRHGHAIYASGQAVTMAEYKAVSLNLMHADLATTDRVYNVLNQSEVASTIQALSRRAAGLDKQSTGELQSIDQETLAEAIKIALLALQRNDKSIK